MSMGKLVECEAFLGGKRLVPQDRLVFRPSAYAAIIHEGKILLVTNRHTGKYALPGGGLELGEKISDAVQREVREETGLEIEIGQLVDFREACFYYEPLDQAFHALAFFYRACPLTFDLIEDERVDDLEAATPRWIEIKNLKQEDLQGVNEGFVALLNELE